MPKPHDALNLPRPLNGGLVLRLATPDDTDALAEFNSRVHQDEAVGVWTRDLMGGDHPTVCAADFALIEDADGHIRSSAVLIPQTWLYDGLPFGVGQLEAVGTDPACRRRGLARRVIAALHELSAACGHHVQAIMGMPWFYRQFGYEYALDLGGLYHLPASRLPALPPGETERYQCRPAVEKDLTIIQRRHDAFFEDYMVTTQMDEALWRYHLAGHSRGSMLETRLFVVVNADGAVVGYYQTAASLRGTALYVMALALADGVSYYDVLPAILRALREQGQTYAAAQTARARRDTLAARRPGEPPPPPPRKKALTDIAFELGREHPVYQVLGRRLERPQKPYAWYLRVPDVAAFILHIASALEERLADSVMSGYSGGLALNFYRDGLRLAFEDGKIVDAVHLDLAQANEAPDAAFPPLVFLKLLFGYRALAELRETFPDCWARDEAALLLNTLFPRRLSWITDVG